ncbi:hypothetical protein [Microtetraspora malaysiensis]|uniref:hypothetical protein n=1 Tax=Microtetraspora malaysiensis TaxID=161358 RepID=UPI000A5D6E98|nr:hypothetical protein [Microtetraspora malaysiensis]
MADAYRLLKTAPRSGAPLQAANPDGNMLTMEFGERGLVTYMVLEEQGKVFIVRVQWI